MKLLAIVLLITGPAAASDFPAWMTGSWEATIDGVRMEEHWTTPEGSVMLGLHRDVRANGKAAFEFLRIEKRDGKLAYVAQPGGRPPTIFPIKTLDPTRVVFENLQHDFPQRIIYWLDGGKLCARVEGTLGQKEAAEEWCWGPRPR